MNYITEAEKKMISENYRKVINELNKKYFDLYPAMNALATLSCKIHELRPDLGNTHAYTFESEGHILFEHLNYDEITLCLGKENAYFDKYRYLRKVPFAFTCAEFDKMMRGENFEASAIIASYNYYKKLSDKFTRAARRLDGVAKEMSDFINSAENDQCRDQRKVVDYFKEVSESAPVMKRLKITVEEVVEELN